MELMTKLHSGGDMRRMASTRNGMLVVAGLVALLAGAFLLLFLSRYRDSVNNTSPVTVLVAKSLIEKNTSGDVVISNGMFETNRITKSEEKQGAISDPAALRHRIAAGDIFPGEQLTTAKFNGTTDSLANKVSGYERAISIPLDSAHGMIGDVQTGDHVDVLAGFNVENGGGPSRPMLRTVMQNSLVLKAPASAKGAGVGGNNTQEVVLRAHDKEAWKFAFSSEYGKVWIVLRAKVGAQQSQPSVVTLESVLFGTKPISVRGRLGGGR